MSTWAVTGKLGTGKGKYCVKLIHEALYAGRRVATNMDIYPDKLLPASSIAHCIRIPDKPTVADLELIGIGNTSYDEDLNGLIVLDELGTWLNSRTFSDKSRQGVIDWLIHSRKRGWDVIFQMQNINQVDKQVRESLIEYVVRCVRMDKVKIPVVGGMINLCSFGKLSGRLPRFHIATIRVGAAADALIADRVTYRGDYLQRGYDTRQIFDDKYPHGVHSVLSAWHTKGRYEEKTKRVGWSAFFKPAKPVKIEHKPKRPEVEALMQLPADRRERFLHLERLNPASGLVLI
jgi:hypothetical protein